MEEPIKKSEESKLKLQFSASDELWDKVLKFKIERGLKNNNLAVEQLIEDGLKPLLNPKIISTGEIPTEIVGDIVLFMDKVPTIERSLSKPLLIIKDEKSGTFYTECHVNAQTLIQFADPDATIDPELQEEYRANRELVDPDDFYFLQMIDDAKEGRTFSDIVIEYNYSYTEAKPLKILGGQHRLEAIKDAFKQKKNLTHGIRVYFHLTKNQRAEIMRISNTNINVSPDLRDRIEEHRLGDILRNFCVTTGIMKKGEDFGDKRKYEDFTPTVRMIRSFIVNFYRGLDYKGENIDEDAIIPYLCKSGRGTDEEYIKIFNKFKKTGGYMDASLVEAGKMFSKLHEIQFKNADKINSQSKKAFKVKAYSLAIITSWAYSSGALQKNVNRLKKLYSLPELSQTDDPLNALAMAQSKHKSDLETYRGLGTRNDEKERGRLLQLFLAYSKSPKPKITKEMCNTAIDIFHSNEDKIGADEKRKQAFGE
jgi:hypothetical protein